MNNRGKIMTNFLKKAFNDMKESAKAQHEVDKANFEAAKAEAKANFEENRGLTLGVIGTLLFGTGLTFFLEWTHLWYLGIPFALAGLVIVILTYPIYLKVLKKYKAKYGEEIIRISNELLENK